MDNQTVDLEVELKERLSDLRQALRRIPGAERRAWYLELLDENGAPVSKFNIKTGRRLKTPRQERNAPEA